MGMPLVPRGPGGGTIPRCGPGLAWPCLCSCRSSGRTAAIIESHQQSGPKTISCVSFRLSFSAAGRTTACGTRRCGSGGPLARAHTPILYQVQHGKRCEMTAEIRHLAFLSASFSLSSTLATLPVMRRRGKEGSRILCSQKHMEKRARKRICLTSFPTTTAISGQQSRATAPSAWMMGWVHLG